MKNLMKNETGAEEKRFILLLGEEQTESCNVLQGRIQGKAVIFDRIKKEIIVCTNYSEDTKTKEINWDNGRYYMIKNNWNEIDDLVLDSIFKVYNYNDTEYHTEILINGISNILTSYINNRIAIQDNYFPHIEQVIDPLVDSLETLRKKFGIKDK